MNEVIPRLGTLGHQIKEGPPTEEPEGHEFQYFDPAPGDLKEEEVKALIHKRIEESSVKPSRRAALLEIVMNRRGAFLTKGCPIKPLVGYCHEIEVMGRPFKEQPSRLAMGTPSGKS